MKETLLRTKNVDETKYFMYIGFRIKKSNLETKGRKLEFNSARERKEFKRMLDDECPQSIEDVELLYDLFSE